MHLLQEIPQDDLHAAVKRCFAVVNSSISEGMSAAVLEVIVAKYGGCAEDTSQIALYMLKSVSTFLSSILKASKDQTKPVSSQELIEVSLLNQTGF